MGEIGDAPRPQMLNVKHRETIGASGYWVAAGFDCLHNHVGEEAWDVVVERVVPHDFTFEGTCGSVCCVRGESWFHSTECGVFIMLRLHCTQNDIEIEMNENGTQDACDRTKKVWRLREQDRYPLPSEASMYRMLWNPIAHWNIRLYSLHPNKQQQTVTKRFFRRLQPIEI